MLGSEVGHACVRKSRQQSVETYTQWTPPLDDPVARDANAALPQRIPLPGMRLLPMIDSGIALVVGFDMTTKPVSRAGQGR